MFGLFGPEKVDFLDLHEAVLTYRSKKKKHRLGDVVKISLQVPLEGQMTSLKMEVVVDSARQLPDKSFLVVGTILADHETLSGLVTILDTVPRPDLGRLARRSERIPIGIRVLSQQLPGFRAVTTDLSMHGAQIQCEALLELNTYMNLTLELELADLPKLTLQGIVVWSRAEEERRKAFRSGIEFTEQHPEVQSLWEQAYYKLLKMQSGSVMHKSMGQADYPVQQEQE